MDSHQMYDDNTLVTGRKQQQQNRINSYSDLSDLNTPELSRSMDLQNLIDNSRFNEGLFTETLTGRKPTTVLPSYPPSTTLTYTPQPVYFESNLNITGVAGRRGIKEEPLKPNDYRPQTAYSMFNNNGGGPTFTTPPPPLLTDQLHRLNGKKKSKSVDKNTDEYKQRRERNNIAVRKSREKGKIRSRETEEKLKLLVMENEVLRKKIEVLSEERNVLKSLFSNVGMLPEHLHRELNKHLDTYQQQVDGVQSMW